MSSDPSTLVRRFIQDAGNATQSLGLGRAIGQIYAFLYFSPGPRNLGDMQHALGISKGSASMVVRQLEQWSAVRKVWVKGDRKDYYEASDWFGNILKHAVMDTVGKKLSAYSALLGEMENELSARTESGEEGREREFLKERMAKLRKFQKRAQGIFKNPLVKALLR